MEDTHMVRNDPVVVGRQNVPSLPTDHLGPKAGAMLLIAIIAALCLLGLNALIEEEINSREAPTEQGASSFLFANYLGI